MSIKGRTAETYLAGIGASGALIASAFVGFVILVGVVTFDAWPRPGGFFEGTDGSVQVTAPVATSVASPPASAPGVVNPAGGTLSPAGGGATHRVRPHPAPDSGGSLLGGPSPGGPSGAQGPVEAPAPPPPEPPPSSNVVSRTVSTVGETVEGTTNVVGDTLGGNSSPGLGGLVGGLGRSLNGTVQGLVGNGNSQTGAQP